jgi:hypothetical protein
MAASTVSAATRKRIENGTNASDYSAFE